MNISPSPSSRACSAPLLSASCASPARSANSAWNSWREETAHRVPARAALGGSSVEQGRSVFRRIANGGWTVAAEQVREGYMPDQRLRVLVVEGNSAARERVRAALGEAYAVE